jgi:type IV secretion system protein TrbC
MGNTWSSTFRKAPSWRLIHEACFDFKILGLRFEARDSGSALLAFSVRLNAAAAGNLPWERPMQLIATSLTGPVAYAIGLIGIAIAGGTMLWGGELTEFGRRACMVGLVVSVLVFAAPMLASAFGVNAAVV